MSSLMVIPDSIATQSYSYDSLNEIKDVTEIVFGDQTWKQTFAYWLIPVNSNKALLTE
jgi:hypothetical protein